MGRLFFVLFVVQMIVPCVSYIFENNGRCTSSDMVYWRPTVLNNPTLSDCTLMCQGAVHSSGKKAVGFIYSNTSASCWCDASPDDCTVDSYYEMGISKCTGGGSYTGYIPVTDWNYPVTCYSACQQISSTYTNFLFSTSPRNCQCGNHKLSECNREYTGSNTLYENNFVSWKRYRFACAPGNGQDYYEIKLDNNGGFDAQVCSVKISQHFDISREECMNLCLELSICDSISYTEPLYANYMEEPYVCTLSMGKCAAFEVIEGLWISTRYELIRTCKTCSRGQYSEGVSCQICPAGWYSDEVGSSSCTQCPYLYYALAGSSNSSDCISCQPGFYMNYTTGECNECNPGKYTDSYGNFDCDQCHYGKYNDEQGMSECKVCEPGTNSTSGSTECIVCEAGKYFDLWEGCKGCNVGEYIDGSCKLCPTGKYNEEAGTGECKGCEYGRYSDTPGSGECKKCPPGRGHDLENRSSVTDCELCQPGQSSGQNRSWCLDCWSGRYSSESGQTFCTSCEKGKYNDEHGRTECKLCGFGKYSEHIESHVESNCELCSKGRYNNEEGMTYFEDCGFCYHGQYSTPGSKHCTSCEPGKYQDEHVQGSCKDCDAGKYNTQSGSKSNSSCSGVCEAGTYSTPGSSGCTYCEPGKYQDEHAQGSCKECELGKFNIQSGSITGGVCISCVQGRYNDEKGKGSCKECPSGKYNEEIESTSVSACVCPTGHYDNQLGQNSCEQCPAGQYNNEANQTSCKNCEAGKYNNQAGSISATACKDCAAGKYNDEASQGSCKNCDAGKYNDEASQVSCKECALGKYNDVTGQTSCKDCASGRYNDVTGQTSCKDCDAGKYNDVYNSMNCKTCPNGWFQDDRGQDACETCPYPYIVNPERTNCTTCEAGKYKAENLPECIPCAFGYYQPNRNESECFKCNGGQYTDDHGQTICKSCPAGFKSSISRVECLKCQKGKFAPDLGFSNCSLCVQGQYNDEEGRISCKQCEAGKYNNLTQQESCKICKAGEYSSVGSSTCKKCEAGKYQDENLQGSCKNCEAGKYNNETGSINSTSCKSCTSGRFADVQGLSVCKVCRSGLYSQDGQTFCQKCGEGKTSSNGGPCTDCPIGYIAGYSSCSKCDPGYSTSKVGATYCSSCRFGKYEVNHICEHCPSGKYSFYAETSCRLCPAGYTSFNDPSDISNQCIQCKTGEYEKNGTCAYCEAGMYNDKTGQTSCQQCPEGSSSDQGSTLHGCDCPGLQVVVEIPHLGEGHCTKFTGPFQGQCTQGGNYNRVSYVASATDCYNDCKVNPNNTNFLYYTDTDPSDNSCWCGTHDAQSCSSNGDGWNRYDIKSHWFSSINSLQACRDMSIEYRADHFSVLDNECILGKNGCDKDQYVDDTNWNRYSHTPVCQECPSGTFKAGNSCLQCPSDAYVNDGLCECPGSQILIDPYLGGGYCLPDNNKIENIPSLEACRNLSISKSIEQPGIFTDRFSYSAYYSECILATNNCTEYGISSYWQRYSNVIGCEECPVDSYKASETQCVKCPLGATVSASGDSCECPSGAEFVHELGACVCKPGWGYHNGSCVECRAEYKQYNNINSVTSEKGGVCANISCPIGQGFSLNSSAGDNTDISAHCAPCDSDSFSNNTNDGECQPIVLDNCPPGQHNEWDTTKNAECVVCPSGKFKDSYGLGECSECPEDSTPSENRDTCHCGRGYNFIGGACVLVECIIENAGSVSKGNIEYITCVNDTIGGGVVNCTNPIEWQPEFNCINVSGGILSEASKSNFVDALQNIGKKLRKNISNECTTLRNEALKNAKEDRKNQLKNQMNRISGLKWWEAVITDNEDFEGYTDKVLLKRRGRPIKYRLATENTPQGEELVIEPNSGGLDSIDLDANNIEVEVRVRGESGKVKIKKHSEESYTLSCNGKNSKTISICGNYTCKGRVWDIGSLTTDTGCVANAAYNGTACECNTNYTNIGGECFCAENYHVVNNECVQCVTGYVNDAGDVPTGINTTCDVDTDGDGIADIDDDDDDDDGWNDVNETACGTEPKNNNSVPVDTDGDDICDALDYDIDGDGVSNANDPDVTSPTITITGGNGSVYFISVDGSEIENPNITVCQDFSITKDISGHPFKIDNLLPEWSETGTKSFTNVLPGVYDYYCTLHSNMNGTITVKQCIIDSNDFNVTICSDIDEDTCDDCTFGSFNISNDGLDTDGDGLCDAGDPDDDDDDVLDDDDHAPLDASVQCTGQTFLNATKCSDWSVCASGYHETAAPSNTQDRECAASNCVATEEESDDGSDGNFYCLHGNISGTTGSCTCTCIDGFSGTNCDECAAGKGVHDGICRDCEYPEANAETTLTAQCVNQTCPEGQGVVVDGFNSSLDATSNCEPCPENYVSPAGSGICQVDTDDDGIADVNDDDIDGDGVSNANDDDESNATVCSDIDEDTCDDCTFGSFNISNDGLDTDGDGLCDAGDPDDDDDDVLDEDDHAPLDASVQCTGQTFLNGTKCTDWSICVPGYHETVAPSNTQDRECAASNCVATEEESDDGSDGNFYCLHGSISGTTGSCSCTCIDGFSGTNCDLCAAGKGVHDGICRDCEYPEANAETTLTAQCVNQTCPEGQGVVVDGFNSSLEHTASENCEPCQENHISPAGSGVCQLDTDGDGIADIDDGDIDGDGVSNANDDDESNATVCSDIDEDTCDDCTFGSFNISNDGLDTDGDGLCDAGDPDDDDDDVLDEDDHAPLDASVQCTGQTFLNGTKCSDWSICVPGYHETVAPSNTQDRECAASNCVATANQNDDGSDGNFYCLHGSISGTTGSCACTCIDGFSGTNCDFNDSAETPYDVCNSDNIDAVQYITLQCCDRCV